eukprot:12921396-Prorocentrum_lima.AAC.1
MIEVTVQQRISRALNSKTIKAVQLDAIALLTLWSSTKTLPTRRCQEGVDQQPLSTLKHMAPYM